MSAPVVTFVWNSSQNDTPNLGGALGDSNWKIFDPINDRFSFLSEETSDQDPNTSKGVFIIPESGSKEVPRQFVNDYSESKWDRVWLGGSNANSGGGGNYRYAYGLYFDGTTSSAPILQAWDSTSHETFDLEVLGSGTPQNSMIRAVVTTNGAPGDSWPGTPLAGGGGANTIALDTGAIMASKMLYWNMRLLVPSTASPFAVNPVLCVYLTYA